MCWIHREIAARGGSVSFRDYMDLALYHPEHGYYSAALPRYGRQGDFLTAPTASRWYAAVLARLLRRLAVPACLPVVLVEVAAGDGRLLELLLAELGPGADAVVQRIVSVESSAAMRRRQQERLGQSPVPLLICGEAAEIEQDERFVVLHASELYDALPVHRVVAGDSGSGLQEQWVSSDGHRLAWSLRPARQALATYLRRHGVTLQPGQTAEINLAAGPFHAALLQLVAGDGVGLFLDYGYEARRLYDPRGRFGGSLACYRRHRLVRDPLAGAGEQDITAHICWDDLRAAAASAGWQEVGLLPLAELLVRGGLQDEMERCGLGIEAELNATVVNQRQEIKRLLDPEGMGSDLKVLIQATPGAWASVSELLSLG